MEIDQARHNAKVDSFSVMPNALIFKLDSFNAGMVISKALDKIQPQSDLLWNRPAVYPVRNQQNGSGKSFVWLSSIVWSDGGTSISQEISVTDAHPHKYPHARVQTTDTSNILYAWRVCTRNAA